jgi:hypothetical protein
MHVRPVGDLAGNIANIFVDLKYEDPDKGYVVAQSFALNKGNPFADWNIPVFDRTKGKISYSGTIQFADGTAQDVTQGGQPADLTKDTLMVGRQRDESEFLTITVLPDLLDQARSRGVAHYMTARRPIAKDIVLRANAAPPPPGASGSSTRRARWTDAEYHLATAASERRRQDDRQDTHSGASGLTRSYPRGAPSAPRPPTRRCSPNPPYPVINGVTLLPDHLHLTNGT